MDNPDASLPTLRIAFSRRAFLAGLGLAAAGVVLSPAKQAHAWASTNLLGQNPVHEDITQAAYAAVLQRRVSAQGSLPATLLNPYNASYPGASFSAEDYFLENKKYLRTGAFWNDYPANDVYDYFAAYSATKLGDGIPYWRGTTNPDYQSAYDVADHMSQTYDQTVSEGKTLKSLIQFTTPDRVGFLHSMLFTNAGGATYYGAQKTKDFVMQWLESAYTYALGTGEPPSDPSCRSIFDSNNQYDATLTNQLDTVAEENPYSSESLATKGLTSRQLRVRTLGMICHTIADSWCPGHTCRAYHEQTSGDPEGSVTYGSIMAFENYTMQTSGSLFGDDNHKPYDLYSTVDTDRVEGDLRTDLVAKTGSLQDALSYTNASFGDVQSTCWNFNSLGLRETARALIDFLDLAFQAKGWSGDPFVYEAGQDDPFSAGNPNPQTYTGVGDWFDRVMFHTYLTSQDTSWICEGGRRTILVSKVMTPQLEAVRQALVDTYGDAGTACCTALDDALSALVTYQKAARTFFKETNTTKSRLMPGSQETDCQKTLKDALAQLYELVCGKGADLDTHRAFYKGLTDEQRSGLTNLATRLGGIVQEFAIDVTGVPDTSETALYVRALVEGLLSRTTTGTVVCVDKTGDAPRFTLRRDDDAQLCYLSCDSDTITTGSLDSLCDAATGITVDYLVSSLEDDGLFTYTASSLTIPDTPGSMRSARGTVQAVKGDQVTFVLDDLTDDGTPFTFVLDAGCDAPSVGSYVRVYYQAADHQLRATRFLEVDAPGASASRKVARGLVVEEAYGDSVRTDAGVIDLSDADVLGTPVVGETLDCLYLYTEGANSLQAIRMVCQNHAHTDFYLPVGDGTHTHICLDLDVKQIEACQREGDSCPLCGYVFPAVPPETEGPGASTPGAATGDAGTAQTATASGDAEAAEVLPRSSGGTPSTADGNAGIIAAAAVAAVSGAAAIAAHDRL